MHFPSKIKKLVIAGILRSTPAGSQQLELVLFQARNYGSCELLAVNESNIALTIEDLQAPSTTMTTDDRLRNSRALKETTKAFFEALFDSGKALPDSVQLRRSARKAPKVSEQSSPSGARTPRREATSCPTCVDLQQMIDELEHKLDEATRQIKELKKKTKSSDLACEDLKDAEVKYQREHDKHLKLKQDYKIQSQEFDKLRSQEAERAAYTSGEIGCLQCARLGHEVESLKKSLDDFVNLFSSVNTATTTAIAAHFKPV